MTESRAFKISIENEEPEWVRDIRVEAEEFIEKAPFPRNVLPIDFEEFEAGNRHVEIPEIKSLDELPDEIRKMLDKLGIPRHEWEKVLGILQVDESAATSISSELFEKEGVTVFPMERAIKELDWVREYAFKLTPYKTNRIAAYHTAYWNGGGFIYARKGAKIKHPIHTYFLITRSALAQADHTLVIADEGSEITFVEGCTAPPLARFSAHIGATEVYAKRGSKVTGIVLQNWPSYVHTRPYTAVKVEEGASVHLVSVVMGAGASTGRTEEIFIEGKNGSAVVESIVFAKNNERIGDFIRIVLDAPLSSGMIITKGVARDRAQNTSYTFIEATDRAESARAHIDCAGLLLTPGGVHETWPKLESARGDVHMDHEAYVGKISEEILSYLKSRGFDEENALKLIIKGFIQPIIQHIPFEYVFEIMRMAELLVTGAA